MHALVIHGGAGALPGSGIAGNTAERIRAGLSAALDAGLAVLAGGGASLDAVVAAVRCLEDDPLFNAGRGAALTRRGRAELDASIMDGRTAAAGAVAGLEHVRNPVELARAVMERSDHVLMIGAGAEEFALEQGFALVPNQYFRTPARELALELARRGERDLEMVTTKGTVGAVALDERGDLAAATSTGGMTLKRPGRVGDSPIIGAGTWARNGVCAVSATGHGEFFIRTAAAHAVCAAVELGGATLADAVDRVLRRHVEPLGGSGGMIAVGADGAMVMDFTTTAMFRAAADSRGTRLVALAREA